MVANIIHAKFVKQIPMKTNENKFWEKIQLIDYSVVYSFPKVYFFRWLSCNEKRVT